MTPRRLVATLAVMGLAIPFGAWALAEASNRFSAEIAPAAVQPLSTHAYTISILNRQNSDEGAQAAHVTVPTGFVVNPASLAAATTTAGGCSAASWNASLGATSIDISAPDQASELAPGCTLAVSFSAIAPIAGNYTWTTGVSRGGTPFDLQGAQPKVTVDGTPPPAPSITQKPPNPDSDSTPTFAFSDSEGDVTFACQLDGGGFSACTSPQTYPAPLAEGLHTFDVKAVDGAANESDVTSYSWTIDLTPPPVPTIDPASEPPNPTKQTGASLQFSDGEGGVSFECRLDAASFSGCTSPKGYSALSDGSHTFQVRALDLLGNTSAPASYTWTIDNVAPTLTLTSKPPNPSNDSTPTFAFSANEATPAGFQCKLDAGAFGPCSSPTTSPAQLDGGHTFTVTATDAAGNTGQASYTWTIDTDPPTVTFNGTPPNVSNDSTPTFSFSSDESIPAGFQCKLDAGALSACSSPVTLGTTADGVHTFTVRGTDAAGNTSSASYAWTIDTVPPTITLVDPPGNPSADSTPTFAFSADEATPGGFQCKLDAGAFEACVSPKTYGTQADGSHTFTAKANDTAGNTGQKSYTWTIDTVNPVVTITSKPADPTNQTTATFTFTSNKAGSTFQCKLDSGSFVSCPESGVTYDSLGAGPHSFSIKASDGLHDGLPTVYPWRIDLTAPPAPSIAGGPPNPTNSTGASFVFSDSEPGLGYACRLDGGAFSPCTSPAAYSGLGDGTHTFEVQATDAAGNTGAAASYAWLVDTLAPDTTITARPSAVSSSGTATFEFTSSEPLSSFSCSLDGGAFASCSSPQTYGGLADGSHSFQVRAADPAGNADPTPASYSWQVSTLTPPDTTPPGTVRRLKSSVAYRFLKLTWALPGDSDFDHVRLLMGRNAKSLPNKVVYQGRGVSYATKRFQNGTYYRYSLISYDHLGNASRRMTVTIKPSALLLSPRDGALVKSPPRLLWKPVKNASYYNVQLYSPRGKLLSVWPARARFALSRSWTFRGRRFVLTRGLYSWFVWPGFGARVRGDYGQLIGQGSFRVR